MSKHWLDDLSVYREPRVWVIFTFGVISGFPWVVIGSMLSAWLQETGVDRASIGLFGLVFASYSINALWSPVIDRVKPWPFAKGLGMRRGWMAICTLGLLLCTLVLSQLTPASELWLIALCAVFIGFFSATQDIAIDAFRIESFAAHEARLQSAGAAMATAGWWTGYSGLGVIPFYLVGGDMGWTWSQAYSLMTGLFLLQLLWLLRVKESTRFSEVAPLTSQQSFIRTLYQSVVQPIAEFFQRSGVGFALALLIFIFTFKIGEAFLGRMSIVFYKEIGFSNQDIAVYSKFVTWWVTIIFAVLGSYVNLRLGIVRGLLIGGIAMASSNLMFAWIAQVGPDTQLLLSAVLIDGFTGAWSTVAFVAFISLLCSRTFTATQYALLASLGNLARTMLSSYSGYVVDWLNGDWSLFFILTAVMVLPSLVILLLLRKRLTQLEQNYQQASTEPDL